MSCTLRWCASVLAAAACLGAADFTYVQKTEITGGSMKRLIDMAARFSKQAAAAQNTTHRFSGDKMSVQSATSNTVYDLSKETITQIEMDKMQYSVITFAEMADAMKKMSEKMAGARKDGGAEVNWKATVDITGNTKQVVGVDAKEAVMKVFIEGRDPQSAATTGMTEIETTMWMGSMPGYETARDFQRKMAEKMATTMNVNPMVLSQMGSGAMKGLMEAGKKLAEMDGIPMETVMRMKGSMAGPGMPPAQTEGSTETASAPAPELPQPKEMAKEAATEKATETADDAGARVTRGRFGGLGGQMGGALGGRFGRRKKKEEAPEQAQAQPEKPAAAPAPADPNLALESVTTVISFNNNAVDPTAFSVPAGFKQIEHPMTKMLK